MTFPQHFDGVNKLKVNILFLPRTQNPLRPAIENDLVIPDPVVAFADSKLNFRAAILNSLDKFPNIRQPYLLHWQMATILILT